jgi:hypothetical protein
MYDKVVLKTRPTHYFPLSSSTSYDLLHNYNNRVYDDIQVIGTPYSASTLVLGTRYTFPIITNSGSAAASLKIKKGDLYNFTAQYTRGNDMWLGVGNIGYNFEINNYNKDFSISFWFNFNNQINGQTQITDTNQILIYRIDQKKLIRDGTGLTYPLSGSVINLLKIYFDYATSTFRLNFNDPFSQNTEAYCYVDKLDQNFQITAIYNKGQIILKVNDKVGTGFVTTNSFIFNKTAIPYLNDNPPTNLTFNFTGESLGDSSTPNYVQNYLVSSLAYYQRVISDNDLDTLASFAYQDGFPVLQSISSDNSYFDFREIGNFNEFVSNGYTSIDSGLTNKYGDYEKIYGSMFKIKDLDNLNSTIFGITPIKYNKPYYNKIDNTGVYTINSSSGMNFVGQGYVQFDDIEYFDFSSKASITCSLYDISLAQFQSYMTIWSLGCGDSYVKFMVYKSSLAPAYSYILAEYDTYTGNQNRILIQQDFTGPSSNSDNIGVSFSNNKIFMQSLRGGSASVSITKPYSPTTSDSLFIGNEPKKSIDNNIGIKNVGIINKYISDYSPSLFDFSNPSTIMFRFTSTSNPFLVSQKGTWSYTIPTATYPTCTVVGTQFNWNSDNCTVSVSSDNGVTYKKILPYQPITNLDLSSVLNNLKVKIEIQTEYDVDTTNNARLSQFEYLLYTNQSLYSNGNSVYISNTNTTKANYTLSSQNSIMSRHKNFGIKFMGDSIKSPGSASIVNTNSTPYQTIDFWYRPDAIASGSQNYLLNNVSGSRSAPYIYLNTDSTFKSLGGTLYINGSSVVDGGFTASANELYHIVLALSASSNASMYFNGGNLGANAISGSATYGHITLWTNQLTSDQILNRYQSYYYANTVSLTDDGTKKYFSANSVDSFNISRLNT